MERSYYERLVEESKAELNSINIPYSKHIHWGTMNKSRVWGNCKKIGKNTYEIRINTALFETADDHNIKTTIIHELLHSCKDCMKHTGQWKVYANKVNKYLGYNITRCTSASEKGVASIIPYKYKVVCEDCGNETYYTRETKAIRTKCKGYYCGKCKSKSLRVYSI